VVNPSGILVSGSKTTIVTEELMDMKNTISSHTHTYKNTYTHTGTGV